MRDAYYDLVGAIAGLDVAQQSLELSRESLKNNRTRVEVGTMAPIDIVAAQAEVASNEEAVIIAEAAIKTRAGSAARADHEPVAAGFWTTRFEPTEQPVLAPQRDRRRRGGQERARQPDRHPRSSRSRWSSTDINAEVRRRTRSCPAVDLQRALRR